MTETVAEQVRSQAGGKALTMPRSEAIGYIRAKTTPVVQAQLDALWPNWPTLEMDLRTTLADDVTERVVQVVIEEVTRVKIQGLATRRAA
jgi:hypothetical protein